MAKPATPTKASKPDNRSKPGEPKKRIHRRRPGLTVDDVVSALRANAGIRAYAAEALKVDRSAITHFIQKHPEVLPELEAIEEEINDIAENALITQIKSGDTSAIKFRLERKAQNRGYGRNLQVSGPNQGPIAVKHSFDLSKLEAAKLRDLEALLAEAIPDGITQP